jgi:endonuclease/exonuclease/phosphatase family metal-dependent hydrolase
VCASALVASFAFARVLPEPCAPELVGKKARVGAKATAGEILLGSQIPLPAPPPVLLRRPEDIRTFTVVAYNMLNLDEHVGKFEWDATTGRYQKRKQQPKEARQREEQAAILAEVGADAVVAQEILGLPALRQFNALDAHHAFHPILERGNDPRGIDIATLLRRDLPLRWEVRSHKHVLFDDPVTGEMTRLFSRDLPVLFLRLADDPRPLAIIVGTHFKSKRDRPGDEQSRRLRKAQVDGAMRIVEDLFREFGEDAPILFAGDFNGDIHAEAEFASLKRALALADAFDVVSPPLKGAARITHTYHPNEGPASKSQIDAIFVARGIQQCLETAYVYRYTDAAGRPKPIPSTFEERAKNPSDHFPVVARFDFPCLLEALRNRSL